jgi:HPt (histidine-containing phosphotransfer) domain-containing protein
VRTPGSIVLFRARPGTTDPDASSLGSKGDTMESSTTLTGRLLDLKQRFVRKMPDRIAAITSTLSGYEDGSAEVRALLERQFHTLAGTAGTYDLDAVAYLAKPLRYEALRDALHRVAPLRRRLTVAADRIH